MSQNPCCLPHLDRFTLQTMAYSKVLNFCYLRSRTHAFSYICMWYSTKVECLARVPLFPEVQGADCLPGGYLVSLLLWSTVFSPSNVAKELWHTFFMTMLEFSHPMKKLLESHVLQVIRQCFLEYDHGQ